MLISINTICFIVSNLNGYMESKKVNRLPIAYYRILTNRRSSKIMKFLIIFLKLLLKDTIDIHPLCIFNISTKQKNCEKSFTLMSCIFKEAIICLTMNQTILHFLFFHSHFFKGQFFLINKFPYFYIIFITILFFLFFRLLYYLISQIFFSFL